MRQPFEAMQEFAEALSDRLRAKVLDAMNGNGNGNGNGNELALDMHAEAEKIVALAREPYRLSKPRAIEIAMRAGAIYVALRVQEERVKAQKPERPTPDIQRTECETCHAPLFKVIHVQTRKTAPIDAQPTEMGNIEIDFDAQTYRLVPKNEREGKMLYTNHWATCPDAQQWRTQQQRAKAGARS